MRYLSFQTVSPGFTIDDIDDSLVQKFKTLAAKKGRIDESVLSESKQDEIHGSILEQIDKIIEVLHLKFIILRYLPW